MQPPQPPQPPPDPARLIRSHLDLAHRAAGAIYPRVRRLISFDEVRGLACIGLAEAAQRYDPARGVAFATFAWYRIQGTIYDDLRRSGDLGARSPTERRESLDALCARGFDPEADDLAAGDAIDRARHAARLLGALARLAEPQRQLVTKHYFEGKSLVRTADELGVSKSWASRMRRRTLARLRALMGPG